MQRASDWTLENGSGLLVKVITVVLILLVFKHRSAGLQQGLQIWIIA
jgi:hypothetical protein